MRYFCHPLTTLVAALSTLLVGCTQPTSPSTSEVNPTSPSVATDNEGETAQTTPAPDTTSQSTKDGNPDYEAQHATPSFEEVQKELGEALNAVADYGNDQKDEYVAEMNKHLASVDESFDDMKSRAEELTADAKDKLNNKLNNLETQREQLREKVNELSSSSGEAWEDLKQGLEGAWSDLKSAVDEAAGNDEQS